ncbi:unnamed protein product, partial [Sphacelaria rigidula]
RCKGPGGGTRQQPCSVWVHPACAWQNEEFAMRSIAGSAATSDSGFRLPMVFFACPQHDKPATYCSCKREEREDEEGQENYIECDSCNEWYHFSCEGLDEADAPDSYSCKRCRKLAAKGQKVSAGERRRNKAKTNEYMSEIMANKVMQIQQWVAEVKNLEMMEDDSTPNMSSNNTRSAAAAAAATAAASTAAIAAGEARYAIMKELLSRKEELEAPLEDDDDADEEQVASGSGKKK